MGIAPDLLNPRMAGFNVIDCEVKNREVVYLLAREDYTQDPDWDETEEPPDDTELVLRVLSIRLGGPNGIKMAAVNLRNMDISYCAMAVTPDATVAVVDITSKSWVQKVSGSGFEPEILARVDGGIFRGGVARARSFGGNVVIANAARQIFERTAANAWELVGPPIEEDDEKPMGFADFDRFSPNDWYAAGGVGEVRHFDGSTWRPCSFPARLAPTALCWAGDGHVYIMASTFLYRGRRDVWERLGEPLALTLPIKDLVWYEDQLWATNDYGVWILQNGQMVEADLPSGVRICAGNLAVRDGVMLLAGYGGAAYKRDGQWTSIFLGFEVSDWFENHRDQAWIPPE